MSNLYVISHLQLLLLEFKCQTHLEFTFAKKATINSHLCLCIASCLFYVILSLSGVMRMSVSTSLIVLCSRQRWMVECYQPFLS